jgi:hypothetical protein
MNREEAASAFAALVQRYGLSPDNPEDGWKLAFALFMEHTRGQARGKRGRKAHKQVEDLILLFGVYAAKRDRPPPHHIRPILRDLAAANEWCDPEDSKAIESLRRRYLRLIEKIPSPELSPEFRNAQEMVRSEILPKLPRKLWKKTAS